MLATGSWDSTVKVSEAILKGELLQLILLQIWELRFSEEGLDDPLLMVSVQYMCLAGMKMSCVV